MKERIISSFALLCLLQLTIAVPTSIRRIDPHCHYVPDFYSKLLRENNITAGGRPIPAWNATSHLASMDALNISLSIASVSTPGAVIKDGFPIDQSRKLARQLNEYGYNLTKQYPEAFRFYASLTLPDVEGSVAEAIYALDTLNASGVILLASTHGEVLGSPLFEPLYAELNKRHTVVFLHPGQTPCPEEEIFTANSTGLPPFTVDFLLDTTRAAVNLVYRNVTQKYPNVKFILAHSGGFLPFATSRVIGALSLMTNWTSSLILPELQKFYTETAISASRWALPSTLALFNTSHVMYGSDFPFASLGSVLDNTMNLDQYIQQNLGVKALNQINLKTATNLFRHSIPSS